MIKILVAGDFCPYDRIIELVNTDDYSTIFSVIPEYTAQMDYAIVNLEAPVEENNAVPIDKCGPNLRCTYKAVKAVKYAGFNLLTLANNHIFDFGESGVLQTLEACAKEEIDTVGAGKNLKEAETIFFKVIKGVRFAFINCCEHEFSIATETMAGANPLNPIQQYYRIQEAKKNADKIIVITHGGHEHYQLPSPRMQETYRFFIDAGADVVVNHHQHCYSGYEEYNGKPIVYGLGNFCFDDTSIKDMNWNEGYMLVLCFDNDLITFDTIPYTQGTDKVGIEIVKNRVGFDKKIGYLNGIISDSVKLKYEHEKWMSSLMKRYRMLFEPYNGRILYGLAVRGWLPFFMRGRKKYQIIDYVECESHLDCLRYALRHVK